MDHLLIPSITTHTQAKSRNMDSSSPTEIPGEDAATPDTPVSDPKAVPGEDAEERLARSRDRNREHARRTRLRKKAQLQGLQSRVKELQNESRMLRQTVEECSIASILLGLSGQAGPEDAALVLQTPANAHVDKTFFTMTGKRKRFVSDACDLGPKPMKLKIKGQTTLVGGDGKAHINWKTGVYLDDSGEQKQLSPEELETLRYDIYSYLNLTFTDCPHPPHPHFTSCFFIYFQYRRERNRMHAKMTRDRKKLFISSVEKTISDLEKENQYMRDVLSKQATLYSKSPKKVVRVAVSPEPQFPVVSPLMGSVEAPTGKNTIPPVSLSLSSDLLASSGEVSDCEPKDDKGTDTVPMNGISVVA